MVGCLWKINERVQLGATPFRAIKLARGSKFFEAAHALFSCTKGEKEREKEIVACYMALHTREAQCCVPVGAFDIPARVPRGKSLSTTVIDDRRVERTALIYRSGGKKYFSGAGRREAEIERRGTAGDTPRRKFTIIFAGAGRAAKWNFHDMAYTSRDETFFPRLRISR